MKYLLVDLENISPCASSIEKDEKVIVFVGAKQTSIKIDLAKKIQGMGENATYLQCEVVGKNALDFVIASQVGVIFESHPKSQVRICSKDKGFDALVAFYRGQGMSIVRFDTNNIKSAKKDEPTQDTLTEFAKFLSKQQHKPAKVKALLNVCKNFISQRNVPTTPDAFLARLLSAGMVEKNGNKLLYKL